MYECYSIFALEAYFGELGAALEVLGAAAHFLVVSGGNVGNCAAGLGKRLGFDVAHGHLSLSILCCRRQDEDAGASFELVAVGCLAVEGVRAVVNCGSGIVHFVGLAEGGEGDVCLLYTSDAAES